MFFSTAQQIQRLESAPVPTKSFNKALPLDSDEVEVVYYAKTAPVSDVVSIPKIPKRKMRKMRKKPRPKTVPKLTSRLDIMNTQAEDLERSTRKSYRVLKRLARKRGLHVE